MRASWRAVITYPPTWIAIAVILALVGLTIALLDPSLPVAAVVVAAGAIAIVAWPAGLAATGTLRRLQDQAPAWPAADEGEVARLRDELDRLEDPRPAYQLQAVGEKRDNLVAMLDSRLNAGELTYGRYRSVAQQVYLAVISNLREVAIARRSISTIDTEYIDARLAELTSDGAPRNEAEILSLQDRLGLATTQEAKVTYLLAQNESAMTLLDRTATALADAPIGIAPHDAKAAMEALRELADRADRYATP